jgi:hypothetical protein
MSELARFGGGRWLVLGQTRHTCRKSLAQTCRDKSIKIWLLGGKISASSARASGLQPLTRVPHWLKALPSRAPLFAYLCIAGAVCGDAYGGFERAVPLLKNKWHEGGPIRDGSPIAFLSLQPLLRRGPASTPQSRNDAGGLLGTRRARGWVTRPLVPLLIQPPL